MFYLAIILLLILPVIVTIIFLRSTKASGMPANAKLLVDAWNSSLKK